MADDPSTIDLGNMSEAEFRAIEELDGDFTNKSGVPDTRSGLRTRINGVFGRLLREFMVQSNEVFAGRKPVPGIPSLGTSVPTRPGDDLSKTLTSAATISSYGILAPSFLWTLNGDMLERITSPNTTHQLTATNRTRFAVASARGYGGVSGAMVYGLAGGYGNAYYSAASTTVNAAVSVAMMVSRSVWQQANVDVPLIAYRSYNNASETSSYQMAFEVGLGQYAGNQSDALIYYRQGSNVYYAAVGSGLVSLPAGKEFGLAVKRTSSTVTFYVNGIAVSTANIATPAVTGGDASMRFVLAGSYDGERYLDGYVRNVAVWTGASQPTSAHLSAYYRVLAGYA